MESRMAFAAVTGAVFPGMPGKFTARSPNAFAASKSTPVDY